jgi:excisionase family DNA binding protein
MREVCGHRDQNVVSRAIFVDMVDVLSVAAAARLLGVHESHVRGLIRRGALPAEKLGRDLALDRSDVLAFRVRERQRGRRLSAANAWALLAFLSGEEATWAKRTTLIRLRRVAEDADWVIRSLRHSEPRARLVAWQLLPVDLAHIETRVDLVKTGVAAALDFADLAVASSVPLDIYAGESTVDELRRRFRPVVSAKVKENVVLRIPSQDWILKHGPTAPRAVIGADLLLDRSQRFQRTGEGILRDLVERADRDS